MVKVIEPNFAESNGGAEMAKQLREVADLIESGEVRDLVVVYDHRGNKKYHSNGFMDDRWRLVGAIEYAKKYVMED